MGDRIFSRLKELTGNIRFRDSALAVTVLSLVTHAYSYFNSSRIGYFDRDLYLPWLEGAIYIALMIINVYLITDILNITYTLSVWLIAGLCITDANMIMGHFYHAYVYAFALIMACMSAWWWSRNSLKPAVRITVSALFAALSFASYGAYAPVASTLVIVTLLVLLLEGTAPETVFRRGIEYPVSALIGYGLYYAVFAIWPALSGLRTRLYSDEMQPALGGEPAGFFSTVRWAYEIPIKRYLGLYDHDYHVMPIWLAVVMLISGISLFVLLILRGRFRRRDRWSYILLFVLLALTPLSAGSVYVLARGEVHLLMTFTFVVFYLALVKLAEMSVIKQRILIAGLDKAGRGRIIAGLVTVMSSMIVISSILVIYKGVLVANMCYARMDNLDHITDTIAMRVLERVENCEGFEGHEDICFAGDVSESEYFITSRYADNDWLDILDGIWPVEGRWANTYYHEGILIDRLKAETDTDLNLFYYHDNEDGRYSDQQMREIEDMPIFPADGSVMKIGDTVVVRFK